MMQVAMEFETLLARFWWSLGPSWEASWDQVASKIDPTSIKEQCGRDVRKLLPKMLCEVMQGHAGREGGGPYNQSIQTSRGPTWALDTPLGPQGPGGGLLLSLLLRL